LRVLFVSHYALPHLGGMEVAIDAMATELTRRGHAVTYIASDAVRSDEPREIASKSYRVVRVRSSNVLENRTGAPWPVFGPSLVRALRREIAGADVVHAHGFLYMSSVAAMLSPGPAARVLTEHVGHVPYESRALDRAEAAAIATVGRIAARRADALVYFNDDVGAQLARLAPAVRRVRIDNGVDLDRFRPPEPGERERLREELGWDERPRALFVGRLVAKKGVDVAVEAAAAGEGAFELAMAGPGRLSGGASGGGAAPPHVSVLGALPRERMAELYRAADVFVLPSRGEGFPLTVQEAMASGLPVVLADDPSYATHLDGAGSAARLVPRDPAAIAAAVRAVLADPDARAAARAHAERAFSWTEAADAHERLYAELTERRARPRSLT
jgi:glycosyltransferase involved in cell wall biosynthesis